MPKRSLAFRTLQQRAVHVFLRDTTVVNRQSCWAALNHWLSTNPIYQAIWFIRTEPQQAYALDQIWQRIKAERLRRGIAIFEPTKAGKQAKARHTKKRQPL